jgi:hypothetical protein
VMGAIAIGAAGGPGATRLSGAVSTGASDAVALKHSALVSEDALRNSRIARPILEAVLRS